MISRVGAGWAQTTERPIAFNIPTQPLASALDRYGDTTGREAFYDTHLAQGRMSGDVQGVLTSGEALQKLLAGTGLSARVMTDNSFVLLPAQAAEQGASASVSSTVQQRYYALIQQRLRDAFCRSSDARPGNYRFVAVFWINHDGAIERSQRLGSAGTADVDQRIDATLRDVRFDEPPPAGFLQPVLVMVVPQSAGVTMGCDTPTPAGRRSRSAP